MIPHNKPSLSKEEATAASQVVLSNNLVKGREISAFEDEMCQFLNLPSGHTVCVSSGSSALFLAINLLKLNHKKVAIPSYSCNSLRLACLLNHAEPIYLDNVKDIPLPETSTEPFDGLIYPYLYGFSSKLPSNIKVPVIEDIAQALGAKYQHKMLGTIGDIGVLSFYATKMITSGGQGGMLVSKNKALIDQARDYLAFEQRINDSSGFNLHMTEVQAAIARVQLTKLPCFIEQRREIWQHYQDAHLPLLDYNGAGCSHVRYRAILKTAHREALIKHLHQYNITAINPFEVNELLSQKAKNAYELCQQTVSLPIYPSLTEQDAKYIAHVCAQELKTL